MQNQQRRIDAAQQNGSVSKCEEDHLLNAQKLLEQGRILNDEVSEKIVDVEQARVDVVVAGGVAITAPIGGTVAAVGAVIEVVTELGNAGVDFAQGQTTDGLLRLGGAGLGGAAPAIGTAARNLRGADEVVETALAKSSRGGSTPGQKGKVGESIGQEILEAQGHTVTGRQVMMEAPNGVRIVADRVGQTKDGNWFMMESKNGRSARLTPNQRAAYPLAGQHGWIPRGNNAVNAGLRPGVQYGPFEIFFFRFDL